MTVQLTTTINGSVLSGTLTETAQNGVATFSDLTLNRPGAGDLITVSSGGLTGITTNPITVNVGAPEQLVVTSQPASDVTAGSSSLSLIVMAEDAGGNPTAYTGLVTLTLGNNPGGATLGGTTLQVNASGGQAVFSNLSINKAGLGYTLVATGSGLAVAAVTDPIEVDAAAATHLVVSTLPPGSVNAGASFGLSVSAVDGNGNPDKTFTGNVTLTLNNPAGVTGTLGGTLTAPIQNGVATFSGLTLDKAINGYTITAAVGSFSVTTPAINVTPAPFTQLVVTSQPTPNPVAAGSAFSVTVSAEDGAGNVDTTFHGTVLLTIQNNPGGADPINVMATAVAGVARFTGLSINKSSPVGGAGYTLLASFGAKTVATNPITVTAGSATKLEILPANEPPSHVTIGSGFAVQVVAVDNLGNVDPNFSGQVTLSLQSNPIGATLGGTTSVASATNGVATFPGVTLLTHIGSNESLLATSPTNPSVASTVTSLFTVDAGAATNLALTAVPPAQITAGSPFNVSVQARDNFGDVDPTYNGDVTLTVESGSGGTPINFTQTAHFVAGLASFTSLALTKAATGLTIQISSGNLPTVTTNTFSVVAGAATQLDLTSGPPSSVNAGQAFGLTVTAVDSFGNVDFSFEGNVAVGLGSNAPAGTVLGGTTSTAAFDGVATFFGLSLNKISSGEALQVSSSGLASVPTGPIAVTPAAAAQLVLTSAPPSSTTAGSPFGLTVVVEDAAGNLDTAYSGNVTLSLASNPGAAAGGSLGGNLSVPVVNGTATFSGLTLNTVASGYLIAASSGSLVPATTGGINVSAASAAQLQLTAAPPANVNAGVGFGVTVIALDPFGNVASSFNGPVTLTLAGGSAGGSLGGTVTVNASGGVATFSGITLNAAASGALLQVNSSGLNGTQTAAVNVIAPPPVLLSATVATHVVARHKTKVIVLQFSAAVDANAAIATTNYSLSTVANGKKHPSKNVALVQPVYDAATHQVTLRTKKALVLTTPLHLAVNVTGQPFVATLTKGGTSVRSAVAIESKSIAVESVASVHHLDALLHHGFRPRFRHLSR